MIELACSVVCLSLTIVCLIVSVMAYVKVMAFEKSTHKIEYIPMPEIHKENDLKNLDKEIKDEEEDFV